MKFLIHSVSNKYNDVSDSVSVPRLLDELGLAYEIVSTKNPVQIFVEVNTLEDFLKIANESSVIVYSQYIENSPTIVLYDDYCE